MIQIALSSDALGGNPKADTVSRERATKHPELISTLVEALIYLDDQQTRIRLDDLDCKEYLRERNPESDSFWMTRDSELESCPAPLDPNKILPGRHADFSKSPSGLSNFLPEEGQSYRFIGDWSSMIHFMPDKFIGGVVGPVRDSNMFLPAAIVYSLSFVSDSQMPADQRPVTEMKRLGLANVEFYNRGSSYNFWPQFKSISSNTPGSQVVGPINVPATMLGRLLGLKKKLPGIMEGLLIGKLQPQLQDWLDKVTDEKINPYGLEALFNIPDDSDDTSTAIAAIELGKLSNGSSNQRDQTTIALERISLFTESLRRSPKDFREVDFNWPANSSLTWLRDQSAPLFESPADGVLPLGANNVDCVVNANVLLAIGLSNKAGEPRFKPLVAAASEVLEKAAEQQLWPQCGIYYPQQMMFPYVLSRAYRDGNIRNPAIQKASHKLIRDLLDPNNKVNGQSKDGSFFGGPLDDSRSLSTALALTSLINFGHSEVIDAYKQEQALESIKPFDPLARYDQVIERAISYLLSSKQRYNTQYGSSLNRQNQIYRKRLLGAKWPEGLFFTSSFWEIAQWFSEPYTVAIILEGLAKYSLAYDLSGDSVRSLSRTLCLRPGSLKNKASWLNVCKPVL